MPNWLKGGYSKPLSFEKSCSVTSRMHTLCPPDPPRMHRVKFNVRALLQWTPVSNLRGPERSELGRHKGDASAEFACKIYLRGGLSSTFTLSILHSLILSVDLK